MPHGCSALRNPRCCCVNQPGCATCCFHTMVMSSCARQEVFDSSNQATVASLQAQKELLDAELDLYKKTQAGEDTAMLRIKYTQLQIEVTA